MNTPIKSISDDQNTVTHKSGLITERVKGVRGCLDCVYLNDNGDCLQFDFVRFEPQTSMFKHNCYVYEFTGSVK